MKESVLFRFGFAPEGHWNAQRGHHVRMVVAGLSNGTDWCVGTIKKNAGIKSSLGLSVRSPS